MVAFKRVCRGGIYLLALVGLLTLTASISQQIFKRNRIRESFNQIHLGDTKEDVRLHLASHMEGSDLNLPLVLGEVSKMMKATEIHGWYYPGEGHIYVAFDDQGHVVVKALEPMGFKPASMLHNFPHGIMSGTEDYDTGAIEIVTYDDRSSKPVGH